ncbi:hypothetical protein [Thermaerobacter marianensis]|uniref:hypothetical protein n=1 Tax=Thermaerobacter marianensis TaxID=73919 RepID=UPI003BFA2C73
MLQVSQPSSWSDQTAKTMEAALLGLPGVLSSHVEVDAGGRVQEIHLLAGPGRAEHQLLRDVQSLMAISFGQDVETGVVHLTRVGGGDEYGESRLRLLRHRLETEGTQIAVLVELGNGDRVFRGEARGTRGPAALLRLAAVATARAVIAALYRMVEVQVFSVQRVRLGHRTVALVGITAGGGILPPQEYVGAVLVKLDETEATCRAVLDGVNRFFALAGQLAPEGIGGTASNA